MGLGLDERKPGALPPSLLRAGLTSRLVRPSRAQARRSSCWKRQQIEVVIGLANPARSLCLFPLPLSLPPFVISTGGGGWGEEAELGSRVFRVYFCIDDVFLSGGVEWYETIRRLGNPRRL